MSAFDPYNRFRSPEFQDFDEFPKPPRKGGQPTAEDNPIILPCFHGHGRVEMASPHPFSVDSSANCRAPNGTRGLHALVCDREQSEGEADRATALMTKVLTYFPQQRSHDGYGGIPRSGTALKDNGSKRELAGMVDQPLEINGVYWEKEETAQLRTLDSLAASACHQSRNPPGTIMGSQAASRVDGRRVSLISSAYMITAERLSCLLKQSEK
jgi:hypothetical protein